MKKPPRPLVLAVLLPFMHACYGVVAEPVPEQGARPTGDIRGLVVSGPAGEEWIEPDPLLDVAWTDSTVALTGGFREGSSRTGTVRTRTFPLSDVQSVLVRGLDGNRTSIIIAALLVGTSAIVATLVTGQTTEDTVLPGGG